MLDGMSGKPKRTSIRATYDSRETGPRYHVTTQLGDKTIEFRKPLPDPFVRHAVHIGWRDLLRCLLHREAVVTVIIGADHDLIEDVSELDDNYLGMNCIRRDAFNSHLNEAIARFVP